MRSARSRSDRGLTLVETMAALLVLSLAVFGLVSSQVFALKAGQGNRNRLLASVYAKGLLNTLEEEANQDFTRQQAHKRQVLADIEAFRKDRTKLLLPQAKVPEGKPVEVDLQPPEDFHATVSEQRVGPGLKRLQVTVDFLDDGGVRRSYDAWTYVYDPAILAGAAVPGSTQEPWKLPTLPDLQRDPPLFEVHMPVEGGP